MKNNARLWGIGDYVVFSAPHPTQNIPTYYVGKVEWAQAPTNYTGYTGIKLTPGEPMYVVRSADIVSSCAKLVLQIGSKTMNIEASNGKRYLINTEYPPTQVDEGEPVCTTSYGKTSWYLKGKLHRTDGPAIIDADGNEYWYKHGKLHRDGDKPAYIDRGGNEYWYQNNKLHREGDKPAVIRAGGKQEWYLNGKLHRIDGPAIIYTDGTQHWYLNGKKHFNNTEYPSTPPKKSETLIKKLERHFDSLSDSNEEPVKPKRNYTPYYIPENTNQEMNWGEISNSYVNHSKEGKKEVPRINLDKAVKHTGLSPRQVKRMRL